jgi:predicted dehydrogenase/threonine dehydrogenase-like Zn-dependent dehydrogenase
MKQVLLKKGRAYTTEVPIPQIEPGEVLVEVKSSCLSIGTELSGLQSSGIPLWKRAISNPEKVLSTIKMLGEHGLRRTINTVEEKTDTEYPTGYSVSGIVVAIGNEVRDLIIGDRVACAGGQYAYHAEYIRVPRNLCVPIPKLLDFEPASTVTLGAIALQGVRRAQPTLGETVVVIGLGILGQLTVQMLRANGCRVIGTDADSSRIDKAISLGMEFGINSEETDLQTVARLTHGFGADAVIITAATSSDLVISNAFKMCRKKGRVVLVGDVGLKLNRADFYAKELDFFISTSYGPGRYDTLYEEKGIDYPIGYVRWTENRNMQEYLQLLADGKINVTSLISARYPVTEASFAYSEISGLVKPLAILFTYPKESKNPMDFGTKQRLGSNLKSRVGKIRIALIGAGSFARHIHLPNIQLLDDIYHLRAVVNRTGTSAKSVGQQFDADYISTNPKDVFADPEIDAVLIATRHHLHGTLVLEALQAGKHVLVEKPLTLSKNELLEIQNFFQVENKSNPQGHPIIMTGYNRRFSPYAERMKKLLAHRSSPFIINYRINAGFIPQDHWVHSHEGGGRNLGEACHFYDFFTFLAESEVISISSHAIQLSSNSYNSQGHYGRNDNFVASFTFNDGSVANLVYTSLGHPRVSKEQAELYVDGKIAILDDYKSLKVYGADKYSLKSNQQDKGLFSELKQFATAIKTGEWPIPLWQQLQVSNMGFAVEDQIFGC